MTEHPGALGSFRRIVELCAMDRVDRPYLPRLAVLSLTSLASSPLRLLERLLYGRLIKHAAIHPSPIFVLGHWRSGTTHLQNLLCQDRRLGYLTAFQAIAPEFCLVGRGLVQRVLKRIAEPRNRTRPMDRIAFSLDAPQEEELAVANVTSESFSHAFVLPRQAAMLFQRYVMFEGLSEAAHAQWIDRYVMLLRKVSLASDGKRLILKNCTNTARIPMLLDLFPDAKFVHICRNPYDVYSSTLHLHESLLSICQLQDGDPVTIEKNVLAFYVQMMGKYLADRSLIPAGNLVELRCEDLEEAPLRSLRTIYDRLGIPGFAAAEPAFRSYIESLRGYKKNQYERGEDAIARVNANWKFAFDEWGYELR